MCRLRGIGLKEKVGYEMGGIVHSTHSTNAESLSSAQGESCSQMHLLFPGPKTPSASGKNCADQNRARAVFHAWTRRFSPLKQLVSRSYCQPSPTTGLAQVLKQLVSNDDTTKLQRSLRQKCRFCEPLHLGRGMECLHPDSTARGSVPDKIAVTGNGTWTVQGYLAHKKPPPP